MRFPILKAGPPMLTRNHDGSDRSHRQFSHKLPGQVTNLNARSERQINMGRYMWEVRMLGLFASLVLTAQATLLSVDPGQQSGTDAPEVPSSYVLGPGDQIVIQALDVEEISNNPIPIGMKGDVTLPIVGRLHAAGLTVEEFEAQLNDRLGKYLTHPQASVIVSEFASQPVSVLGAVKNPGVHQLQGRKTLAEILSLAGGTQDDAGYLVKITRRKEWGRIPLPNAREDPTGQFTVAEVDLRSIVEAKNPSANILIRPHDVISIPRAQLIYVIGQVRKPGGFVLRERESVSALQALSLAEGLDHVAAPGNARIIRSGPDPKERTEVAVDLKKILEGKAPDIPLRPEDILFVPTSNGKAAALRSVEAAIATGTGIAIWRR